jgi:hypothetical protein
VEDIFSCETYEFFLTSNELFYLGYKIDRLKIEEEIQNFKPSPIENNRRRL